MAKKMVSKDKEAKRYSCTFVIGVAFVVMLVTILLTSFIIYRYLFPGRLSSVQLSQKEKEVLEAKVQLLNPRYQISKNNEVDNHPPNNHNEGKIYKAQKYDTANDKKWLEPSAYNERPANRLITFSQREVNGLIAENPTLAGKLSLHLDQDLVSAKAILPVSEYFPIIGGKNLRINAGLEVNIDANNTPVVILHGISVMGVPIPSEWLGGLKNINLAQNLFSNKNSNYGNCDKGAQDRPNAFLAGFKQFKISQGSLLIELNE